MQTGKLSTTEKNDFYSLLAKNHLSGLSSLLEPHLERCILIEITEPDEYQQIGNSRRCGWPDFPPDWSWPLSKQGKYLNFICQINLKEIAQYQDVLPRRGILYFFMGGHELEIEGHIRYYDGDLNKLANFQINENLSTDKFSLGFRPDFESAPDSFLLHQYARKLRFHPTLSIPDKYDRVMADEKGIPLAKKMSFDEWEKYDNVREDLMNPTNIYSKPPPGLFKSSIHQRIFGYEYCQTFNPRDFGKYPCEGPPIGIELFCISDHDEFFQNCLDGTIIFAVRQDELMHCQFTDVFVAIEG